MTRGLAVAVLFTGLRALAHGASADDDWQKIVGLESARIVELDNSVPTRNKEFVDAEKLLWAFIAEHPKDPRALDVRLRLASLLAIRGMADGDAPALKKANALLAEAAAVAPNERKGDVAFTRLTLLVRSPNVTRHSLWQAVQDFQKSFSNHPRFAELFVQAAAQFDAEPSRKKILLESAFTKAGDNEELRAEIGDELKKIDLLDKPLPLKFTSVAGEQIDVQNYRGKVVLIYFFAGWSPPSMARLSSIQKIGATPGVQGIGISLDADRDALLAAIATRKLDWPIACESEGWKSPLVRSLGINTLPTCWLLDKRGNLRTLNARDDLEPLLRELLRK